VVRDVDAGYGAVRVLHGVSIEIRQGETVALLGTNGNGKSTLINCIMGIVRPAAGEIFLDSRGSTSRRNPRKRSWASASPWCRRGAGSFPS